MNERERPILFSGPMVRAILAGTKTQTRRVVKPAPVEMITLIGRDNLPTGEYGWCGASPRVINRHVRCPYGVPGDRLWVREMMRMRDGGTWEYAADSAAVQVPSADNGRVLAMVSWAHHKQGESCPSIHMPWWASRLTLEVTEIRVRRLREITTEEIEAEGVQVPACAYDRVPEDPRVLDYERSGWAASQFATLWDSINGKRPGCDWASDPWVWAISFRRQEAF